MAIKVNTRFHPFRLNINRKEPVQLSIELENTFEVPKMLTMELVLSRELSLDKGGIHNSSVKRIDALESNKAETYYYNLYPKLITRSGEQPMQIKILQHYNEYKFVEKEQIHPFTLRVDD